MENVALAEAVENEVLAHDEDDGAADMVRVKRSDAVLLDQIRETAAEVSELQREWKNAKDAASDAKKRYDDAAERLVALANATEQETPLFDFADRNAWRDVPLSIVIGEKDTERIWDKTSGVLASKHLGPFTDFLRDHPLTDLSGIGEKTADRIMDAVHDWWRANPDFVQPGEEPEGDGDGEE